MKRIIYILFLFPALTFGQAVKYFAPVTAMIITGQEAFEVGPSTIYTNAGVTVNIYADEATKNDAITKISASSIPALPASGEIKQGMFYSYNSLIIQCLQSHIRTVYDPLTTPALFAVYRDNTGTLSWVENEQVKVGWIRTFESKKYTCLQSHQTLKGWEPTKTLGVLWSLTPTSQAWASGVAYKVGDIVTYSGNTYRCLQSHTSISTWYPSAVPALWQKQ